MAKTVDLTQGSVFGSLIRFTIPVFFTLVLQSAYGTVDLIVVSQFASVADISAVTTGSGILASAIWIISGISMGTTVLVGRHVGAQEQDKAGHVIGVSIVLFTIIALLASFGLATFSDAVATLMNAPAESFEKTSSYLFIVGIGMIFLVAYNLVGGIFRGIGDSQTPLLTVAIACVINIILDVLFIKGWNLGASGAAYATVIAQASSVVISVMLMRHRQLPFTLHKSDICFDGKLMASILKLGIPLALQSFLCSISFMAISAIINGFGVVASAAMGIAMKGTDMMLLVATSFSQSLSAYTAQNYGARKLERAKRAMLYGILIAGIFGLIAAYVINYHGSLITGIFTQNAEVAEQAIICLRAFAFDCIFTAGSFSIAGYFSGYGKTTFVMTQTMIGSLAIRLPLSYFLSLQPNTTLYLICLACPLATGLQVVICVAYYRYINRLEKRLGTYNV